MAHAPPSRDMKRECYLGILHTAQQVNDPVLVRMMLKKLAGLGNAGAVSTASGCRVIPFPAGYLYRTRALPQESYWWGVVKAVLAVPGSLAALFCLSIFSM